MLNAIVKVYKSLTLVKRIMQYANVLVVALEAAQAELKKIHPEVE